MDARMSVRIKDRLKAIPQIAKRPQQWEAAAPSRALNLGIGASWLGFLYTLGFFGATSGEPVVALSFADTLAVVFFLVILTGIMVVLGLAVANHRATAPVSAIAAVSIIVLGATCGFAGHPVSAWGPDAALAAGIAMASIGVLARGGAKT